MKKQLLKISIAFTAALMISGLAMAQITPQLGYSLKVAAGDEPTVDAVASDAAWTDAVQYDVARAFYGDTAVITGPDDISGWFKTCWNDDGMYVIIWSKDDRSFPAGGNGAAYEMDLNEIYFKIVKPLADNRGYGGHKSNGCNNPNNGTYQFAAARIDSTVTSGQTCFNDGMELSIKLTGDVASGYECIEEFYIPWANLKGDYDGDTTVVFDPNSGDTLGFDVDITDNDSVAGITRQRIVWSNNGVPDENWNNTTNIGRMLTVTEIPNAISSVTYNANAVAPTLVDNNIYFDAAILSINVYDVSGKLVMNLNNLSGSANLSQLNQGVYILRMQGKNLNITTRIVKK